ncbi:TolC family protein [Paracoccaceae bacterium]|nr:TolC family protein [Paracoccaceae bacterium]
MSIFKRGACLVTTLVVLAGCQSSAFKLPGLDFQKPVLSKIGLRQIPALDISDTDMIQRSLPDLLKGSNAKVALDKGFAGALRSAVNSDPLVLEAQQEAIKLGAKLDTTIGLKDFQLSGDVYGGVEDVTDEIVGIALALNAERLIYDGGRLDARIAADKHAQKAAVQETLATMNERALVLARYWAELERYDALNALIESRLLILDPMIEQLERVADAGVGDISRVTAAERTVSMIRVTQTNISERREQARVAFLNSFGALPQYGSFDYKLISSLVPKSVASELVIQAPGIQAAYASYLSAEAKLADAKKRDGISLNFRARAQRPLGGSEYGSDEAVGLVLSKPIYRGNMLASEIKGAEAVVENSVARLQALYREGERTVRAAYQTIGSMDKAMDLARESARVTKAEIRALRKQLIIGGSTLDSVLSAEARLYDAEAKEINFLAERRSAELVILSALGLLTDAVGL